MSGPRMTTGRRQPPTSRAARAIAAPSGAGPPSRGSGRSVGPLPASACVWSEGHCSRAGPGRPPVAAAKAASMVRPGSPAASISRVAFDTGANSGSCTHTCDMSARAPLPMRSHRQTTGMRSKKALTAPAARLPAPAPLIPIARPAPPRR